MSHTNTRGIRESQSARRVAVAAPRWRTPSAVLFVLAMCIVASNCTVKLIADYDEHIDTAATELQKRMDGHLSALRATANRNYAPYADFYVEYAVDLRSVRVRAASHEKNRLSVNQYDLMLENTETLRALHESEDSLSDGSIGGFIDSFNLAWTVIISLEVAKKRGAGEQ
jgi:hypothetical protein